MRECKRQAGKQLQVLFLVSLCEPGEVLRPARKKSLVATFSCYFIMLAVAEVWNEHCLLEHTLGPGS